ncbi:hypothetical protein [Luteimonas sp. FCS-9]|uniref:hypothetical protein n=1 Tax=Luteimonas sp. FCS-9 TaxID=1547516 RepID=UPI0012E0200B|nr:hypothetical protein [Luteimonas sp. FCS-9]
MSPIRRRASERRRVFRQRIPLVARRGAPVRLRAFDDDVVKGIASTRWRAGYAAHFSRKPMLRCRIRASACSARSPAGRRGDGFFTMPACAVFDRRAGIDARAASRRECLFQALSSHRMSAHAMRVVDGVEGRGDPGARRVRWRPETTHGKTMSAC